MGPQSNDLAGELLRHRTVQVAGPLDREAASANAALLMTLDATGDEPIDLRLLGRGGTIEAAMVLVDTIDLLGVPLRATAVGPIEGPLALVLVLSPRRFASPSSRIVLRPPAGAHQRSVEELSQLASRRLAELAGLCERLAAVTSLDRKAWETILSRGRTFGPSEALDAGLVDAVGLPTLRPAGPRRDSP